MGREKDRSIGVYWSLLLSLVLPFAVTLSRVLVPLSAPDFSASPSPLGYSTSLLIFAFPVLLFQLEMLLHPDCHLEKRAYRLTVIGILLFGSMLDLFLGNTFFYFPNTGAVLGVLIPAFSLATGRWVPAYLPIEEFGFYLFGATYMISLYLWGILYWFKRYNRRGHRHASQYLSKIFSFNPYALLFCLGLCAAGIVFKKLGPHPVGFPGYFVFLVMLAFLPCIVLYDVTKYFINWRAFIFMSFMLLLVSIVYEGTLGVPYGWWKYHEEQMLGLNITGWSGLPIEAPLLWVAAAFGAVLVYEALRIFLYMDRSPRAAFFGHGRPRQTRAERHTLLTGGQLPLYIDDGVGLPVPRGPYVNPKVDMANFLIAVDIKNIRAVCDRYLNNLLNGQRRYVPFLSVVLLTYAKIIGYATDEQGRRMGLLPENDLVIWIPTIAVRYVMGLPVPTHLAMFPYRLYVDSAYGLSAGREVFGFQKTFASFTLVEDIRRPDLVVSTLAFPTFQPEVYGQVVPTITIKQLGAPPSTEAYTDASICWSAFWNFLLGAARSHLVRDGLEAVGKFIVEEFRPSTCSVSIKQFRDVEYPHKAALQQVIEAKSQVTDFYSGGLLGSHDISFATLASDPFVQDLGLILNDGQLRVDLGFWVSVGFNMDMGRVIS